MDAPPRSVELLNTQILNKGTAFNGQERSDLGLHGLLPYQIENLSAQVIRAYDAFQQKQGQLERHIYLRALQDTNEVLFYRLLLDHIEEMMPIVYTPVVALGCRHFSHIYRRPRGLFISYPFRDSIPALLRNRPSQEVDVMVVTDGERILGIGDQGVGGIHPARTLPIVLDVGTNNPELLRDPQYLGWRHERVTGQSYFEFIDRLVAAVQQELPHSCLQWEDFARAQARPILDRYRNQLLSFNDDIQGTAAVVLGAILSAAKVLAKNIMDMQVVLFGAGSASIGVADYLRRAMVSEGLADHDARSRFWILDDGGLLHTGRRNLSPEQLVYAQPVDRVSRWQNLSSRPIGLADVMANVDASVLIGLSTVAGSFTEPIVRQMAAKTERPIIFPLSNPTENSEAVPEDLIRWSSGRAIVATGSPFARVHHEGRNTAIAQCNNVYIFPAVGLGAVASRAWRITDGMLQVAARTLAEFSPALADPSAPLLPALTDVRRSSLSIAIAVGLEAQSSGVAPATSQQELIRRVHQTQWTPQYAEEPVACQSA